MSEFEAVPVKALPQHPQLKAVDAYPWEITNAIKLLVPQLHIFEISGVGELVKRSKRSYIHSNKINITYFTEKFSLILVPSVLPKSAYSESQ